MHPADEEVMGLCIYASTWPCLTLSGHPCLASTIAKKGCAFKSTESEELSIMYWYVTVFIGMYRNLSLISGFYRSVSDFFVVSDFIGS